MARLFAAAVLLVAFAFSGAFASEPGQPLDCSDWVFLKPGLSCTTIFPRGQCIEASPGSASYACSLASVDSQNRPLIDTSKPAISCG